MCFYLLPFPTLLKKMFYNYLIFSMVALSLCIFLKYFVSLWETLVSKARNFSFKGLKLEFQSLETNRFTKGNTLFLGEKQNRLP